MTYLNGDLLGRVTLTRANARSIALAHRLGAVLDPDAARTDPADLVFRHPVPGALG